MFAGGLLAFAFLLQKPHAPVEVASGSAARAATVLASADAAAHSALVRHPSDAAELLELTRALVALEATPLALALHAASAALLRLLLRLTSAATAMRASAASDALSSCSPWAIASACEVSSTRSRSLWLSPRGSTYGLVLRAPCPSARPSP